MKLTRKQASMVRRNILFNLNDELKGFKSSKACQDWLFSQYPKYDYTYATNTFYCEKWDYSVWYCKDLDKWIAG